MAVFTNKQLVKVSRGTSQDRTADWTDSQINLATQAVEDWFEANRASIATAINAATTPYVFTNPVKKQILKHWLLQKFRIE